MDFLSLVYIAQIITSSEGHKFPRHIEDRVETPLGLNFPPVLYGVENNGRNNSSTKRTRRGRAVWRIRNERVPPLHSQDKGESNPHKMAGDQAQKADPGEMR
jgi:hypothetical protein